MSVPSKELTVTLLTNYVHVDMDIWYIAELLSDADTVSISETWLRPGELCITKPTLMNTPALNVLNNENIVIYAKSGMTTTYPCYVGRPYGGVAVACKQRKTMQYTEFDIMSDRIIGVKVCNNSDIVEIIYMPFYNGEAHQTDCYAETIDVLQSVIEQFGAICPIHIIGDLNGDFGMTMIDLVPGPCMKHTNISKRCSDVELGSA